MDVSLPENGQILGDEVTEMHVTLQKMKKIEDILDEKHNNAVPVKDVVIARADEKQQMLPGVASSGIDEDRGTAEKVTVDGNQDSDDGVPRQENVVPGTQGIEVDVSVSVEEEEEEDVEMDAQEHQFSVGDFVWGKIKSHPWWPGQIYNPSDASGNAGKYRRRDRVLVAYFGDDTFAWCYPSQLKPFRKDFEQMSKQSNSKSFTNAVEEALNELGRCIESEMACSCVLEETRTGLTRPLAVNAGIKEGVTIPEGHIGELSITEFEPASFLVHLRDIARVVSVIDLLELTVLRCRLSAFFRAKGCGPLPAYHEPQGITDPEENADENLGYDETELDGKGDLTQNPAEEGWLSSPVTSRKRGNSLSGKRLQISEDKLYQRKKKSMAELMGEKMDSEPETDGSDAVEEGKVVGKPALPSKRQEKTKHSASPSARTENKDKNSEDVDKEGKTASKSASLSRKRKKSNKTSEAPSMAEGNRTTDAENDDTGAEEGTVLSSPRIRKKSKYLSPPYTFLGGFKGMILKDDVEIESPKDPISSRLRESIQTKDAEAETPEETSGIPQIDESGSRIVSRLTGSPPIVKCGGETFQKRAAKGSRVGRKTPGNFSPRTPKEDWTAHVVEMDNASAHKMLSEIRLVALDTLYLKGGRSSDRVVGFFAGFRRYVYCGVSDYGTDKKYGKGRVGRKRKSQLTEHGSLEKTEHGLPEKHSGEGEKSMAGSHGRKRKTQLTEHGLLEKSTGEGLKSMAGSRGRKRKSQLTEHGLVEKSSGEGDWSMAGSGGRKRETQLTGHGLLEKNSVEGGQSMEDSGGKMMKTQLTEHGLLENNSGEKDQSMEDSGGRKRETQHTERASSEKSSGGADLSMAGSGVRKRKTHLNQHGLLGKNSGEANLTLADLSGKKRRPRLIECGPLEKNSGEGDLPEDKSQVKKRKVKDVATAQLSKKKSGQSTKGKVGRPRRVAVSSGIETANGERSAALLLTFAPGITLPSKDDLLKVFGKFGDLKESETEVLKDSGCARIVFAKISDAEEAFNGPERKSAFGLPVVGCRLKYPPVAYKALETNGALHIPPAEGVGAIIASSQATAGPQLQFMQQNLEMMMSMLSESAGEGAGSGEKLSPEVRANLAGEIDGLLKKVATLPL
ncbi:PWWP domain-containing protein 3-like isoform X2 [Magnolia sinica]|uniref:PWWP domain-containing protein 3-like isoform X2 n=1 Tax=Magnolia sinica TaxID=86752 RepID=UPI00265AEA61|nr:PWWP domain-containing protein 3-like isoform X2 [Magnolia sinica]